MIQDGTRFCQNVLTKSKRFLHKTENKLLLYNFTVHFSKTLNKIKQK